jgi:hypothetical protein
MRAMNERMTCLQSSVDDVLWFLSQSRLESRQANQGRDRDLQQTRPPPPESASAWAVARSEALARSATILGSGMLSSARYNNFPTIPKQVACCSLHVNAESHALAWACLFPRALQPSVHLCVCHRGRVDECLCESMQRSICKLIPRTPCRTGKLIKPPNNVRTHTHKHTHKGAARAWIHPMAPVACPRTDSHSARE